jgi:hypothetical protein
VAGSLWIQNCVGGRPLEREGDFDLKVDFFAGETIEDTNPSLSQRRNSLLLRLQNTSNNIEESDSLMFQFVDVRVSAQSMAAGLPVPVTSRGVCALPCAAAEDPLRARLTLYTTCPACAQPIIASNRQLVPSGATLLDGAPCLMPSGVQSPACPALAAADQTVLDSLCSGDFKSRSGAGEIQRILGGGACAYFCQFGKARAGQSAEDLAGFRIDYGERVAALFALNVVDARALQNGTCAEASGQIYGMFSFEVARGQAAQSFP